MMSLDGPKTMNSANEHEPQGRPHWPAWLLLVVPPLMCCAVVSLVTFVPGTWPLLQFALVSILPFGASLGCTIGIGQYLSHSRWLVFTAICAGEMFLILIAWGWVASIYLTSWK